MRLGPDKLQRGLEDALSALTALKGEKLTRQIKPILLANIDRRRLEYFSDGNPDRVHAYVWLVARTFAQLNPYLHQLQIEKDPAVWEPLYERMQTWAYNYLLRKNFVKDENTREIAIECASDAAVKLLQAHFPYDTEFDAWAHIIVQHACKKYIENLLKKSNVPDGKKAELDEELFDPNELHLEISALQKESGKELFEALNQLSEARRFVIQSIFFDGMEAEEVARKLGKSVGAIYNLQFNAFKDLRKILGANRDIPNE